MTRGKWHIVKCPVEVHPHSRNICIAGGKCVQRDCFILWNFNAEATVASVRPSYNPSRGPRTLRISIAGEDTRTNAFAIGLPVSSACTTPETKPSALSSAIISEIFPHPTNITIRKTTDPARIRRHDGEPGWTRFSNICFMLNNSIRCGGSNLIHSGYISTTIAKSRIQAIQKDAFEARPRRYELCSSFYSSSRKPPFPS